MPSQIKVQAVDIKDERRRRVRRRRVILAAGLLLLAVAGVASWYFTPPAMPTTIEEARELVNSPRFDRLSKQAKQPYYDVIREQYGSLNREERKQLREADEKLSDAMRDAGTIQMRMMLVRMAEMAPEDRDAMMATFGRGRPQGDRPERSPEEQAERAGRMRDHISDRMANGDSQMNQLMRELFSQKYK